MVFVCGVIVLGIGVIVDAIVLAIVVVSKVVAVNEGVGIVVKSEVFVALGLRVVGVSLIIVVVDASDDIVVDKGETAVSAGAVVVDVLLDCVGEVVGLVDVNIGVAVFFVFVVLCADDGDIVANLRVVVVGEIIEVVDWLVSVACVMVVFTAVGLEEVDDIRCAVVCKIVSPIDVRAVDTGVGIVDLCVAFVVLMTVLFSLADGEVVASFDPVIYGWENVKAVVETDVVESAAEVSKLLSFVTF